jgi:DNA-binding transcriptional ArsR family regulator
VFDKYRETKDNRTQKVASILSELAEAGLLGDRERIELVMIKAIRALKDECPDATKQLSEILSKYTGGEGALRWHKVGPPPADQEEGTSLLRIENAANAPSPVLPAHIADRVDQFIHERKASKHLVSEGFAPPSSLLLKGLPGTGKTMLARWLARQLELRLVVLDLATSVSSYLGKTGYNLRRSLDYARSSPCLLLLDEFDAIAKRRDDTTDVGELKRIVNVLLKELESWPLYSVLVAATNHPDLLDPAIHRRFHVVLEVPLPGLEERRKIMECAGGRFCEALPPKFLEACVKVTEGVSGSDLDGWIQAAVRQHLVTGSPLHETAVSELQRRCGDQINGGNIGSLIRAVQQASGGAFTVRQLAAMFGKSVSTVQHHLKREDADA